MSEILESGRNNIVVLGAGFGGITALLTLRRRLKRRGLLSRYHLVLISKNSQHLYTPALYEIASLPRGEAEALCLKSTICIHIEDIIAPYPEIRFIGEEVCGLDPEHHLITLKSGNRLSFEYAILALGAETNFFGIPGLQEYAYPLKTFEDAVRLRNRAEELMQRPGGRLEVIMGGGGATGVELSAEFVRFFRHLKKSASVRPSVSILIVEASSSILPGFDQRMVRRALRRLDRLGIRILAGMKISRVTPTEVWFENGASARYDLLVWSGGVQAAGALKNFGLTLDRKGGIAVNEFLQAESAGRIYAIGDNAGLANPKTGNPLPWNVPVAEAEARRAAKNIIADITGGKKRPFRPLERYPFILAVGGKYALADLIVAKFFGFAGWALKQLVELRYLLFILPWAKAFRMWLRAVYYSTRND